MSRLIVTGFAAIIALSSIGVFAADLTPDEGTELRQRADEWQRMRAQNPNAGQEGMRFDRPQGDVKLDRPRGEVKAKPKAKKAKPKAKKSKTQRAKDKIKRTAKTMPGALVRKQR